jgi:hypothetical protein
MNVSFWLENKEFRLNLTQTKTNDILVTLGKNKYMVSVEILSTDEILLNIDGNIHDVITVQGQREHIHAWEDREGPDERGR